MTEDRAKYSADDLKGMLKKGHAIANANGDPSYPIADQEDLEKAIKAVGRGGADHDSIRAHIISRAKALKLATLIPDNWNSDGSLQDEKSRWIPPDSSAERRDASLSFGDQQSLVYNALLAKFNDNDGNSVDLWVCDCGSDWVVFQSYNDGSNPGPGTWRLGYSCDDGAVVFDGDPVRVAARTSYEPVPSTSADGGSDVAGATLVGDTGSTSDVTDGSAVLNRSKKRRHRSGLQIGREFRRFTVPEIRAHSEGSQLILEGMPIVYSSAYRVADMLGEFDETMHPGVCAKALDGADVRFLVNHEGLPLGRTTSGTLELEERDDGLHSRVTMDSRQQLANDLAVSVERGDVTQMSVGFIVGRDEWSPYEPGEVQTRDIYELEELFDVSAVTYPASPTTSIEVAQRTMAAMPLESRARIRRLWSISRELREGKVLSADNAQYLQDALERLHEIDTDDLAAHGGRVAQARAGVAAVLDAANAPQPSLVGDDGTQGGNQGAPAPLGGSAGNDGTGSRKRKLRLQMEASRTHKIA